MHYYSLRSVQFSPSKKFVIIAKPHRMKQPVADSKVENGLLPVTEKSA
jgi:hypothetical protein